MTGIAPFLQAIYHTIHRSQKSNEAYPLRLAGPFIFFLTAVTSGESFAVQPTGVFTIKQIHDSRQLLEPKPTDQTGEIPIEAQKRWDTFDHVASAGSR